MERLRKNRNDMERSHEIPWPRMLTARFAFSLMCAPPSGASEADVHSDIHLAWVLNAGRGHEERGCHDAAEAGQVRVVGEVVDVGVEPQFVTLRPRTPSRRRRGERYVVRDASTCGPHGRRSQAPDAHACRTIVQQS